MRFASYTLAACLVLGWMVSHATTGALAPALVTDLTAASGGGCYVCLTDTTTCKTGFLPACVPYDGSTCTSTTFANITPQYCQSVAPGGSGHSDCNAINPMVCVTAKACTSCVMMGGVLTCGDCGPPATESKPTQCNPGVYKCQLSPPARLESHPEARRALVSASNASTIGIDHSIHTRNGRLL